MTSSVLILLGLLGGAAAAVNMTSTTISLKYTLDAKPGQLQPTCEEIGDEGKTSIAVALRAVLKANPADIKWDGWKTGVAAATMATHKDQIKGVEVVCSTECAQPRVEARVTILAPRADAQNVLRLLKEHASMGAAAAVAIDIKYQALNVNYTYASQASGGLQGTVSSWGNSGIKFCRKPGAVNSTCEEIAGFGEQCDISCPSVVAPATCGQTNDVAVGGQTDAGAGGGQTDAGAGGGQTDAGAGGGQTDAGAGGGQTDAGAGGGQTDAGAGGQGFGNVPTAGQNGTTATVPAGGFTNQGCSAVTHCVFPTPATQDNIPPACALGVMQDPPPASAIGDCDTSKWAVGYTPEWKCVKQVATYLASNCMTEEIEAETNLAPATFAITFSGLDLATLTEADKVKMISDIRDKVAGMLFKHAAVPKNTAPFLKIGLAAGSVVATVELPLYVNASATDAAAAELGEVELTVAGKPVKSSPVKATAPKVPSQESVGECPSTVKDKETCLAACKANDQWTGAAEYVTVEFGDIFKRCECGSKHKTYTHCETMDFTVPIVLIIVVLVLLVVVCCCCCKCCGCCCFKKSASAVQPKDTASEATLPALGGGV